MGNVNLPTPVALAGGAICILGGYLLGVVAGPDTPTRTTATVESYDDGDGLLCLVGETVQDQQGVDDQGRLCGIWRRPQGSGTPEPGAEFRFVPIVVDAPPEAETAPTPSTILYGDVVR
jgi:hypothetical protein